jgi:hypothetical protein
MSRQNRGALGLPPKGGPQGTLPVIHTEIPRDSKCSFTMDTAFSAWPDTLLTAISLRRKAAVRSIWAPFSRERKDKAAFALAANTVESNITGMQRKGALRRVLSVGYPFLLPLAALATWIVTQSNGQVNDPVQILASIDPSGDGTAYLSTIIPDGAQALWECSSGTFAESGENTRHRPERHLEGGPGFSDSVTVRVITPSAADSIRFLPVIREVTPSINRVQRLPPGRARPLPVRLPSRRLLRRDRLGRRALRVRRAYGAHPQLPGGARRGWVLFPGDSLTVDLPLGADFEAVALDGLEGALDNSGAIMIRFLRLEGAPPMPDQEAAVTDSPAETMPGDEFEGFYEE